MKVFEPLKVSVDSCQSGLVEVMVSILGLAFNHMHNCVFILCYNISIYALSLQEICLLGLVARRWDPLIESFVSHTFSSLPISKQYANLHQLLQGTYRGECRDKILNLKVLCIFIICLLCSLLLPSFNFLQTSVLVKAFLNEGILPCKPRGWLCKIRKNFKTVTPQ